jgi:hypothetical protein
MISTSVTASRASWMSLFSWLVPKRAFQLQRRTMINQCDFSDDDDDDDVDFMLPFPKSSTLTQ